MASIRGQSASDITDQTVKSYKGGITKWIRFRQPEWEGQYIIIGYTHSHPEYPDGSEYRTSFVLREEPEVEGRIEIEARDAFYTLEGEPFLSDDRRIPPF